MNKSETLDRLERQHELFLDVIDGLSDEALQMPGVVGEWSIKDTMIHISRWEAELVKLLFQAANGQKPSSVHFSKIDVDKTNQQWYEEGRQRSLNRVLEDFHSVRNQTILRVEQFSDRDISDPDRFPWSGQRPLFDWIASDSYDHEAEHAEQIAAWRKLKGL